MTDTEELTFEAETEEDNDTTHVQYDIASYPSDLTLSGIKQMWDNNALVIPEFQRKFVWKIEQASLLIDSFLCGLPVPPVFFYINTNNENLVIDGQQRIMSIIYFLNGFFGDEDASSRKRIFRLKLPEGHPYSGKSFAELPEDEQRKLEYSSVLRAINIKQLNPDDDGSSAYHIFERLNTGGTPLKPQEIRNCVYQGKFSMLLEKLNQDIYWRKVIGRERLDPHQKDIELLLRVFAFFENKDGYEKPMKDFLNKAMKRNLDASSEKVNDFCELFPKVTKELVEFIGEKPFHVRGPMNISVLESVMTWCLLNYESYDDDIAEHYLQLKYHPKFDAFTTSGTTSVKITKQRYELVDQLLSN